MKSRGILFLAMFLTIGVIGQTEDALLQPADNNTLSSFLGEAEVNKVRILSETDESLNIEVSFKGFEDKEHVVKAKILNHRKKAIKGINVAERKLAKGVTTLDFHFQFKKSQLIRATTPYLKSKYLQISLSSEDDPLNSLTSDFDLDLGLSGSSFLFHCKKDWRVGGNEQMIISVHLKPIGKAQFIKP